MDRREFMSWAGTGFIATSLPMALAACSPAAKENADTVSSPEAAAKPEAASKVAQTPDAEGFISVGNVSDLDTAGFLADRDFPGGAVIVVRDPEDAAKVVALSSVCTHEGCTVRWRSDKFACACHGSSFAPDGAVEAGPAENPGNYRHKWCWGAKSPYP